MNVTIPYDGYADGWSEEDVRQVMEVVARISAIVEQAGHAVTTVPVRPGVAWMAECCDADLLFNLCEGIGGVSRYEPFVVGAFELMGIPFTGAGARAIALCHEKHVVNALLAAAGLPVPPWVRITDDDPPDDFPLPAFVKPAAEDASVGIDQGSVVTSRAALRARVDAMRAEYDGLLVQRYVPGAEMAVGFVGDTTLPVSQIDFSAMPAGAWPIVSFEAKWVAGSLEDAGTQPMCPAPIPDALARRVTDVARAAWRQVGGAGYGRVDLRVDEQGVPWIIEINPNPDISDDAGLANMGRAAGIPYDALVMRVVDVALRADVRPLTIATAAPRGATGPA